MNYYYSFNKYLKETFGERVHRLSLNAGFSCPNIDGTLSKKGCIFCNNKAFSYFSNNRSSSLEEQITKAMDYARRRYKANKFIAYFQSFTNTYGDINTLKEKYRVINNFKDIVGLAISTRCDCIDEEKLDLIESFSRKYTVFIEYGLQTVHDKTLRYINRNHTFSDFKKAAEMTSRRKTIKVGAHIILGLPNESKEMMLTTAEVLSTLPLWGIKFHCLHVVKQTPLENMYNEGKIKLLSEDEYIDILISFLEVIPKEYVILRLISDADRRFLVAPLWINEKQRILRRIEEEFKKRSTYQGRLYESFSCKSA